MKIIIDDGAGINLSDEIAEIKKTHQTVDMQEIFRELADKFPHVEFVLIDDEGGFCGWRNAPNLTKKKRGDL